VGSSAAVAAAVAAAAAAIIAAGCLCRCPLPLLLITCSPCCCGQANLPFPLLLLLLLLQQQMLLLTPCAFRCCSPVVPAPAPQASICIQGQRVAAATNQGTRTKAPAADHQQQKKHRTHTFLIYTHTLLNPRCNICVNTLRCVYVLPPASLPSSKCNTA
jgi:hypothetical protein